ncbi:PREDICTED: CDPK-related kinase 6-like isoform X1 [Camelina sativa]|uniref:non-specific serine/threonine protein kinase n=1 Tax=Camelina sativa TaxID=90675 RepID=A0ABM0ZG70_CAMSA|nr:PREDICTED: CDPK-related kinase 6-like isoform X1 [Camelina sativa]
MGHYYSRNISTVDDEDNEIPSVTAQLQRHRSHNNNNNNHQSSSSIPQSPAASEVNPYNISPFQSPLPAGVAPSPASTPGRKFKWPFPPPSPAKPIMAALRRRRGAAPQPRDGPIPEDREEAGGSGAGGGRLDKNFGFAKNFEAKYELGKEVGRGHFGHTCWAKAKKGKIKGQTVAVKIISKSKMTSALSIEDVRREVKLLKSLSGHSHMVKFYDVFEDADNVFVVMELCEGGELLDRILARGGRYPEADAKRILVQILSATAFFHLQGVVHRDLKPENFLFTSKNEDATLKVIDFGLSDFARFGNDLFLCSTFLYMTLPSRILCSDLRGECFLCGGLSSDQRLNDVVGSAYYVAPEVLHRSYSTEADIWSIGVISYILLCGSRPFYGRTESAIFRCVLRANPNFEDLPWPSISPIAKDFVKRLLNKDHRKRMTAAQALAHPWLRDENPGLLLDFSIYKLVKSYIRASPFRRAALKALSKAIPEEELVFLKAQFMLLDPEDGGLHLHNFTTALTRYATDAMIESRLPDILNMMQPLAHRKLDFEEFCAAAVSVYQLEALEEWEQIATIAFDHFEREGSRAISVQELAEEMSLGPNAYPLLRDWIRSSDGKLNFLGYAKFLHGVTVRSSSSRPTR